MKMTEELSHKIKIVSLICTLFVVLRHSLNMVAFYGQHTVDPLVLWVESGFSILTEIAVPFFFMISGFFFFRNNYYDAEVCKETFRKKFYSLVIPFIIWNIVGFWTMIMTGLLHFPESFGESLKALCLSEYYGPLWYVRNILLLMLFSPLYAWIYRVGQWWLFAIVFLCLWCCWAPVDCSWYCVEGCLFFFMGGVLQQKRSVLSVKASTPKLILLVSIWLVLCFVRPFWCVEMNRCTTLFGCLVFWFICDTIRGKVKDYCLKLSAYSFIVYVLHFFFVKGLKVLIAEYYPQNAVVSLLCYFCLPLIVSVILFAVAYYWKKMLPCTYRICVGGR